MRVGDAAEAAPVMRPTFVEVVPERAERSTIRVRVGLAEIEVHAGFDARLLREVAEALGGARDRFLELAPQHWLASAHFTDRDRRNRRIVITETGRW